MVKKHSASILVVDDEAYVRDSIRAVLERNGYSVRTEPGPAALSDPHVLDGLDAVITDLKMDEGSGLELIKTLKGFRPEIPVIVLTAFGSVSKAVECVKAGAYEFLEKPEELLVVLQRALRADTMRRELEYLRDESGTGERVWQPLGRSAGWRKVLSLVEAAAPTDAAVLLLGESGTGKEEVARLIHRCSLRRQRRFVSVNCAAVPLELFESEFFAIGGARSPELPATGRGISGSLMKEPCFWMKSVVCRTPPSPKCCACWKRASSNGWGKAVPPRWTCA